MPASGAGAPASKLPALGVIRSRLLPGRFTVPAVAQDGSADGLSANGSTLVLSSPRTRSPRTNTQFAILDVSAGLRVRYVARLRGDYSFDAISPDGGATSATIRCGPTTRALAGSIPTPIVDPHAPADHARLPDHAG